MSCCPVAVGVDCGGGGDSKVDGGGGGGIADCVQ